VKKVVAFNEITFTKVVMMIITVIFVGFSVKQFLSPELTPEFTEMVKLFVGVWAVYGGKSGYEHYSRNRYSDYDNYDNYDGGFDELGD